jgi:hypothetical protein
MSLKDQIIEVKQKIAKLEFELAVEKAVLGRLEPASAKGSTNQSNKENKDPRRGSLAAQAREILTESPKVLLSVAELSDALIKRGFATEADKAKLNTLIPSALRRRPDIFVSPERGFYGLKIRQKDTI